MGLGVAFRAFWGALTRSEISERVRIALESPSTQKVSVESPKPQEQEPKRTKEATRSEALTLLSTLQREARLVDLVQESLDAYDDAQVGAAAREVLRDCKKTLDRLFDISPLSEEAEGSTVAINSSVSANLQRLSGKSQGSQGQIVHRGWKANRCDLPNWSGSSREATIIAPVEVEVQ